MNRNSILVGQQFQAYLLGLLAIIGFSLTLPATKFAVLCFGVMAVGMGRVAIAESFSRATALLLPHLNDSNLRILALTLGNMCIYQDHIEPLRVYSEVLWFFSFISDRIL